jgi:glycosyltransferase involved in cell wall biosynthesis
MVLSEPLVSVVTPFHNTAAYLAECIESVLAQTYSHFEYILADNCSTDGSKEIAETYARRDPRIRLIRFSELLPQVANYNRALQQISPESKYCKIVQADDSIYPACLNSMVQLFERSESIGLVTSYDLKGDTVRGSGFPQDVSVLPGKDAARYYLRGGVYVFGSPTTVMYRSAIVRAHQPFFVEGLLHEDTEKCLEILQHWDFGFVHQVLSRLRTGNESISSSVSSLQPGALDHYIILQRFAPVFLTVQEAGEVRKESKRKYYGVLALQAIRFRGPAFWRYHKQGLATLGEKLDWLALTSAILKAFLWLAVNPGNTILLAVDFAKRSFSKKNRGGLENSSELGKNS